MRRWYHFSFLREVTRGLKAQTVATGLGKAMSPLRRAGIFPPQHLNPRLYSVTALRAS